MVQSTPQRSGMVQRTPQHPAMVQALPEQAQAVRSPAGPPRTVAAVSTQGAGQTLAERRNLAEIMSQVTVPEAERKPAVAPVDLAEVADRKSTRLNSITNAHLVCRLLLEQQQ